MCCTDPQHCRHCNTWNECVLCLNEQIDLWVDQISFKWTMFEIREERRKREEVSN